MPNNTLPTTSPFATAKTNAEDVARLIAAGLDHMEAGGDIHWADMPEAVRPFNVDGGQLPIGYSRAWLIVRRAYLEVNEPSALVTLPTNADAVKQQLAQSKVIVPMRNEAQLSWGEIAVRCGKPESHCRKVYTKTPGMKDLGLRIGKGGRFAYDEPEFYLEHRKGEGAHIPNDGSVKGRPKVEQLLNAKGEDGKIVRFQRSAKGGAKKTA